MLSAQAPVGDLKSLGITTEGTYNMPCYLHGGIKPQLSITVGYSESLPVQLRQPERLEGLYNCFSCGSRGRIKNGKLYPSAGIRVGNSSGAGLSIPRAEKIPVEYSAIYAQAWKIYAAKYPNSFGEGYLRHRGLPADKIRAGFCPSGSQLLLKGGLSEEKLIELDLIDQRGRDKFGDWGGRVILPLSWQGQITGFYGRSVSSNSQLKHRYSRSNAGGHRWRRGVFGERALDGRKVVITEAVLDALALRALGIRGVSALGGVFHSEAISRIKKNSLVVVALDNDETGNRVAEKLLQELGLRGLRATPPTLPDGKVVKDWADYVQQMKLHFPKEEAKLPRVLLPFLLEMRREERGEIIAGQ